MSDKSQEEPPKEYELEVKGRGIVPNPNFCSIMIGLASHGIGSRELVEQIARYPLTGCDPWALMSDHPRTIEQVQKRLIQLFSH